MTIPQGARIAALPIDVDRTDADMPSPAIAAACVTALSTPPVTNVNASPGGPTIRHLLDHHGDARLLI
jgi:hypothetical protein